MGKVAPCKECTERYVGCHSECRGYLEYKKAHDEHQELIRKNKEKYHEFTRYKKQRIDKALRKG